MSRSNLFSFDGCQSHLRWFTRRIHSIHIQQNLVLHWRRQEFQPFFKSSGSCEDLKRRYNLKKLFIIELKNVPCKKPSTESLPLMKLQLPSLRNSPRMDKCSRHAAVVHSWQVQKQWWTTGKAVQQTSNNKSSNFPAQIQSYLWCQHRIVLCHRSTKLQKLQKAPQ